MLLVGALSPVNHRGLHQGYKKRVRQQIEIEAVYFKMPVELTPTSYAGCKGRETQWILACIGELGILVYFGSLPILSERCLA